MKRLFLCLLIFSLFFMGGYSAQAEVAPAPAAVLTKADESAQDVLNLMLGALVDGKYATFLSVADEDFKAALSPEGFQKVLEQLAPRLKGGFEATYFGTMKRKGSDVYIWKISYKDKGDDALVQISLKDGKVGGFDLR